MNACSACKHGRRKCSKSKPSCASCLRLGKICVYIEDTVQTHFDVEVGTAPEGNSISLFSHETTTDLGYGTSRSKDPQDSSQATGVEIVQRRRLAARPSPVTILPNNSVDPFFKSPGRLNEQGREALDHIYRGSFHPFLAMLNCGLVNRVRETAAFFQLLAYSSWHLAILRNERQDVYSLQYAARANQELQKQICDPITSAKVEFIMAVLVFASSCAQMGDPETAKVHIKGAQHMMKYQRNLSLDADLWERAIVFWVETVSCSFADLPVYFPAPTEYLTEYKRSNNQVSQWIETNVVDPTVSPVFSNPAAVKAINAIREIQVIIPSEAYKKDIYHDTQLASNHVLPIFHDLLGMLNHDRSVLQEGFRLAAMIFIHELQAMIWGRIPPPLFLDKLHRVLSSSDLNWSSQDPVLFWILAVTLTSDMATPDHKACFTRKFRLLVSENRITNFDSFMTRVIQISWDYNVLKMRTDVLRGCFEENYQKQKEREDSG